MKEVLLLHLQLLDFHLDQNEDQDAFSDSEDSFDEASDRSFLDPPIENYMANINKNQYATGGFFIKTQKKV